MREINFFVTVLHFLYIFASDLAPASFVAHYSLRKAATSPHPNFAHLCKFTSVCPWTFARTRKNPTSVRTRCKEDIMCSGKASASQSGDALEQFISFFQSAIDSGTFVKCTLSSNKGEDRHAPFEPRSFWFSFSCTHALVFGQFAIRQTRAQTITTGGEFSHACAQVAHQRVPALRRPEARQAGSPRLRRSSHLPTLGRTRRAAPRRAAGGDVSACGSTTQLRRGNARGLARC